MRKQYPLISIILGVIIILALGVSIFILDDFLSWLAIAWGISLAAILIPEAFDCDTANKSSRPFLPNRNAYISAGVLILVNIGLVCWDLLGSRGYFRGLVSFMAFIAIGAPSLLSVIINTANLIYKKRLIKKSRYTPDKCD